MLRILGPSSLNAADERLLVQPAANGCSHGSRAAPYTAPWRSRKTKPEHAFWHLYYAFCIAICTSASDSVRADYLNFCFCCTQCACNVRHVDLGPLRISFRQCRCKQVPGSFSVASLAEQRYSVQPIRLRPLVTLSQFYTDHFKESWHQHATNMVGLSRIQDDLQGSKLNGRAPRQRIIVANLHLPSVPPESAILPRKCQVLQVSKILRGYGVPEKVTKSSVTQHATSLLRIRSVENRVSTVSTHNHQLRADCSSLAPAITGLSFLSEPSGARL